MSDTPTLLVPVDLADCTDDIVERASQLAQVNRAQVVLLHVVQIPEGLNAHTVIRRGGSEEESDVTTVLVKEAGPELDRHVGVLRDRGIDAARRIEVGKPVESVLAVADEIGPELIVMGTHGRAGLSRLLMGSVAEAVSRQAPCPVVTVRSQHRPECEATSCATCDRHVSPGARAMAAETDG